MNAKNSNPKFTGESHIFHYTFLFDAYDESVRTVVIPKFLVEEIRVYVNTFYSIPADERIFQIVPEAVQPMIIEERLGHKDIKATLNTYGHLYPSEQEKVAEML